MSVSTYVMLEVWANLRCLLPSSFNPPPYQSKGGNKAANTDGVVPRQDVLAYFFMSGHQLGSSALHIRGRHRKLWREEENCTDEQDPGNSNVVNRSTPFAESEGAFNKFDFRFIELMGKNDRHIRQV